jgi:hypothetical protein
VGKVWWQLIVILLTFAITLVGVAVVAALLAQLYYAAPHRGASAGINTAVLLQKHLERPIRGPSKQEFVLKRQLCGIVWFHATSYRTKSRGLRRG